MASPNSDHLSDIISIVQAGPKKVTAKSGQAPAQKEIEKDAAPAPEAKAPPPPKPAAKPKKKSKAGRKPLPDKNRRSEILIIRLTKAEKKRLWELAKKKHTTLSSFVRKSSIGEYDKD